MRDEFGLDALADCTLEDVPTDQRVLNPLRRVHRVAIERARGQLGTLHRRLERATRGPP